MDRLTHPSSLHSSDAPWRRVVLVVTMPAAGASRPGSQQCPLQHLMSRVSIFAARRGHWSQLGVSSMGLWAVQYLTNKFFSFWNSLGFFEWYNYYSGYIKNCKMNFSNYIHYNEMKMKSFIKSPSGWACSRGSPFATKKIKRCTRSLQPVFSANRIMGNRSDNFHL